MKKTIVLMITLVLSGLMMLVIAQNSKPSQTVWKYEVPRAPYGLDKGKLILNNENNELTGIVEISPSQRVNMRNISIVNDTLRGSVYIDAEYVRLLGNVKDSVIVGTVDTSMGLLDFKAKKESSQ